MLKKLKNKDWLYNQYWNKEKTLRQIGEMCEVSPNTIKRQMIKFGIDRRRAGFQIGNQAVMGKNHHQWSGGCKKYWGKLARRIWEEYYDYLIPKGFIIHHRDTDITNNDIDNLVMLTRGLHRKAHKKIRSRIASVVPLNIQ